MYLWLKLCTVPFFVSGQTYKISKGSNNYCSHCLQAMWRLEDQGGWFLRTANFWSLKKKKKKKKRKCYTFWIMLYFCTKFQCNLEPVLTALEAPVFTWVLGLCTENSMRDLLKESSYLLLRKVSHASPFEGIMEKDTLNWSHLSQNGKLPKFCTE